MNEYGFDFDFEVDNESTMLGKGMWLVINIFALTFSAMTTGAFFYTYVGDAFEFLFGAWSPYVSAFAGMVALDGLSRAWAHVRGHWSDTTDQMAVARFMSWADLVASVIVTVVYLLLNAAFDVGIYNPLVVQTIAEVEVVTGGELSTLGLILNVVGVLILVAAIAGNFVAAHLFSDTSSENREAVHKAEMGAMAATTRHRISKKQAVMTANHTMNEIMSVLPEHTRTKGADNMARYIDSKFGDGVNASANAGSAASADGSTPPTQAVEYFTVDKPSITDRVGDWFGKGNGKRKKGKHAGKTAAPHPTAQPVEKRELANVKGASPRYAVEEFNEKKGAWQACESYPDFSVAQWHVETWTRSTSGSDLYRVMYKGRQVYHSKNVKGLPLRDEEEALHTADLRQQWDAQQRAAAQQQQAAAQRQEAERAARMKQDSTAGDAAVPPFAAPSSNGGSSANGNTPPDPNG